MALPQQWTREDILSLSFLQGINSAIIRKAVENYKSAAHLMESRLPPALSAVFNQAQLFGNRMQEAKLNSDNQLDLCQKHNVNIITIWDDDYPVLLKEIPLPPVLLFVKGELQDSSSLSVSIVGKRDCTDYGAAVAKKFAGYFADNNVIVCSGMARGVDSYAHESAINAGGVTYAVIASGIDMINSYNSEKLAGDIVNSGGALISEYPCGTIARLPYFPQRNRIISGVSKAVIVIESSEKGGSLITARFAFEQFRDVYAVPGNITSQESAGCNNLIKTNLAKAVQSPDEILADLGVKTQTGIPSREIFARPQPDLSEQEKKVFELLNAKPLHVDELAINSGMDIPELSVLLLNMEFKGLIKSMPGGHYVKSNIF